VDTAQLLDEIARGNIIALIPTPRAPANSDEPVTVGKRWYSMAEVGEMLGFGISNVKQLVITRELRSVKVGVSTAASLRRIRAAQSNSLRVDHES
jgi:hypothetical protein